MRTEKEKEINRHVEEEDKSKEKKYIRQSWNERENEAVFLIGDI
jgi:hypothetical protein